MGTPILREENAMRSSNIAMFQDHPCFQEPCHNGGRCNPQLDTYECVCLSGFSGGHCQNSEYLWPYYTCLNPYFKSKSHSQAWCFNTFVALSTFVNASMIGRSLSRWVAILAGLRAPYPASVKSQWVTATVQIVLFPHPTLSGFPLKGYMAAFWLLSKRSLSGTAISDTLCNAACSWLAPMEVEPSFFFLLVRPLFQLWSAEARLQRGYQTCDVSFMWGLLCIDFKLKWQLWKWWNVSTEYSWNAPCKSCTSLSSSSCHSARHILTLARSVLHTQSLPSPLTLRVWPAVPFTLIKTTNAPAQPPPICPHSIAFSSDNWTLCLIDWCDLILWTILCPPPLTAIYEKSAGETEAIAFDGRTFIEYHNAVTKR